jgi:hypothetical protein
MSKLNIVNSIPVTLPEREILFRMKFNVHKTELDDDIKRKISSVMNRGFSVCEPKVSWFLVNITG